MEAMNSQLPLRYLYLTVRIYCSCLISISSLPFAIVCVGLRIFDFGLTYLSRGNHLQYSCVLLHPLYVQGLMVNGKWHLRGQNWDSFQVRTEIREDFTMHAPCMPWPQNHSRKLCHLHLSKNHTASTDAATLNLHLSSYYLVGEYWLSNLKIPADSADR